MPIQKPSQLVSLSLDIPIIVIHRPMWHMLNFLKKHLGGPYFDLEKIWEEHTEYEFAVRSVARTMGPMVQEPYVNNVPTVSRGCSP
jgi:hypothetical protein